MLSGWGWQVDAFRREAIGKSLIKVRDLQARRSIRSRDRSRGTKLDFFAGFLLDTQLRSNLNPN